MFPLLEARQVCDTDQGRGWADVRTPSDLPNTETVESMKLGAARVLRSFLRQPLVGAAVSRLRDALHDYGTSSDVAPLIATVQDLYNQQGPPISTPHRMQAPLAHSDLHLVCYEFVI